jgi:hypothetical protein
MWLDSLQLTNPGNTADRLVRHANYAGEQVAQ